VTRRHDKREDFVLRFIELSRGYHATGDAANAKLCLKNAHKLLDAMVTQDAEERDEDERTGDR
jgi:hypothetical protein